MKTDLRLFRYKLGHAEEGHVAADSVQDALSLTLAPREGDRTHPLAAARNREQRFVRLEELGTVEFDVVALLQERPRLVEAIADLINRGVLPRREEKS